MVYKDARRVEPEYRMQPPSHEGVERTAFTERPWTGYVVTPVLIAAITLVMHLLDPLFGLGHFPGLYVFPVTIIAYLFGAGPTIFACILSLLMYGFVFLPPSFHFQWNPVDPELSTRIVLLLLGSVIGGSGGLTLRNVDRKLRREIIERKKSYEKLRRYELLSEHTRDTVLFIRSDDGRILEANAAAARAYGYSREELLALTIHDLRAPESRDLTASQMAEAENRGILFQTRHIRKDGSTFPVEVSSQGAMIGNTRTLISLVRDITERIQAQDDLTNARDDAEWRAEELRTVLDAVPAMVLITRDADASEIVGNTETGEILGVPKDTNISSAAPEYRLPRNIRMEMNGVEIASHELPLQRAARGEEVRDIEFEIVTDDKRLTVFGNAKPLIDDEGQPRGAVGAFIDITQLKEAQHALEQALSREHDIAHTLQQGLASLKPYIDESYPSASAYLPAFTGEEIGGDFYDVFLTEDGLIAVVIGDVSGKGVTSAAMAFLTRNTIRAVANSVQCTKEISHKANNLLCKESSSNAFVTVFLILLDPKTGHIRYSSAGHPPAAIHRSDGEVEFLLGGGVPMGIMTDMHYPSGESLLGEGDKLILYTDGISEARQDGEFFGGEGIERVLSQHGFGPPDKIVAELLAAVDSWANGMLPDDRAIMVIERRPKTAALDQIDTSGQIVVDSRLLDAKAKPTSVNY